MGGGVLGPRAGGGGGDPPLCQPKSDDSVRQRRRISFAKNGPQNTQNSGAEGSQERVSQTTWKRGGGTSDNPNSNPPPPCGPALAVVRVHVRHLPVPDRSGEGSTSAPGLMHSSKSAQPRNKLSTCASQSCDSAPATSACLPTTEGRACASSSVARRHSYAFSGSRSGSSGAPTLAARGGKSGSTNAWFSRTH